MKIGIYDPYLDDLGGGEKYMLTIASCLSNSHEVNIFWDKEEDLGVVTDRFSIDLSKAKIVENIFAKNFSLPKRLIESKKYDVIVVLSDGSIPTLISKKILLHIQQPIINNKLSLKAKLKARRVSKIFCNSIFTQSFLPPDLKNKSVVIYPPIDLKPKKNNKENIILTVGRFRVKNVGLPDYKKQTILLDTFLEMCDQGLKNWKFILATSVKENEEKEFNKLREKAKGKPVDFLVNKKNDELWDIYSKAKIYWHATGLGEDLNARPEFAEHFGISTVEAMGAGVVPVVINAGGQKEIVDNCNDGFLFDDLEGLKKNTIYLIGNEDKLKEMSKKASLKARKFADLDFCSQIHNLIK